MKDIECQDTDQEHPHVWFGCVGVQSMRCWFECVGQTISRAKQFTVLSSTPSMVKQLSPAPDCTYRSKLTQLHRGSSVQRTYCCLFCNALPLSCMSQHNLDHHRLLMLNQHNLNLDGMYRLTSCVMRSPPHTTRMSSLLTDSLRKDGSDAA